MLIKASAF